MSIQNAALYARVSTADGRQDHENQLIQLREYCQRQAWNIVHEYIDQASGKRSDNRREFQALMSDASRRQFDVVVVWALDRFTREGVMKTFDHIKQLKAYGVEFESYTEQHFRTTGPAGELMIAIAAWIAEQERLRISERTKAGMERARRAGTHVGRPPVVVDRVKAQDLYKQGLPMRAIGKRLGVSAMKISRVLAE
jgi:DNA invertase Pin-like site-specific DNA recombinase